mmetsp:Transcript_19185/g.45768  ORF Transcript_19185/g.45768 Transcript_19185/m.45768 type:complete len:273 (+) Transcript_19185:202-1020(+)
MARSRPCVRPFARAAAHQLELLQEISSRMAITHSQQSSTSAALSATTRGLEPPANHTPWPPSCRLKMGGSPASMEHLHRLRASLPDTSSGESNQCRKPDRVRTKCFSPHSAADGFQSSIGPWRRISGLQKSSDVSDSRLSACLEASSLPVAEARSAASMRRVASRAEPSACTAPARSEALSTTADAAVSRCLKHLPDTLDIRADRSDSSSCMRRLAASACSLSSRRRLRRRLCALARRASVIQGSCSTCAIRARPPSVSADTHATSWALSAL